MILTELFDSSFPINYIKNEEDSVFATFDTTINTILCRIEGSNSDVQIAFYIVDDNSEINMNITGSGDTYKVFGTILKIIKNYNIKYRPKQFGSASKNKVVLIFTRKYQK